MANVDYVVEWVPDDESGSMGADSPELPVVPSIPHVLSEGNTSGALRSFRANCSRHTGHWPVS